MSYLKLSAAALLGFALFTFTGCGTQPKHPNQLSTFDGDSYDSLTAAHAALTSLRVSVSSSYPKYTTAFNQAGAAYGVAYNAYATYRTAPASSAAVTVAIANLAVAIVSLEDTFQTDLHVSPQTVTNSRSKVMRLKAAAQQHITISDILTELEIAATIAESVPGTQPYSTLAAIVIKTTQTAVAALTAASGQPIDLSKIQPIAAIQ
ncbi:MAG TPA: hypothetical protein VH351_00260 [Bryobacteraceae bacterium]|jgi:hypothetical protein|nr:hypothetical protein [Bryobacteraceae bacterium]